MAASEAAAHLLLRTTRATAGSASQRTTATCERATAVGAAAAPHGGAANPAPNAGRTTAQATATKAPSPTAAGRKTCSTLMHHPWATTAAQTLAQAARCCRA